MLGMGEGQGEEVFSPQSGCSHFPLPPNAMVLTPRWEEGNQELRAELFSHGQASVIVPPPDPQSYSPYDDTGHGGDPLPPWYMSKCKYHRGIPMKRPTGTTLSAHILPAHVHTHYAYPRRLFHICRHKIE